MSDDDSGLRDEIIESLKTVYDPEIPVDIYELGLIYDLAVDPSGKVDIRMTLTSPACPVAGSLPGEVEAKAATVPGVSTVEVELVWDPPWTMELMSGRFRLFPLRQSQDTGTVRIWPPTRKPPWLSGPSPGAEGAPAACGAQGATKTSRAGSRSGAAR